MSRLKLHFDFGWHSTRSDAAGLDGRLRTFRPFVLVSEDTTLSREKRLAQILGTNLCIDAARKGKPGERALIEEVYSGSGGFQQYTNELLLRNRAILFFLEDHGKEREVDDLEKRIIRLESIGIKKILGMLSEESISVLRQLLDACMEMCSIREPNILENLGTLESDLARLYPRFRDMKEIKVFVRYGLAHRTIYDKACEAGMEATCWYDPMEEPTGFLILRMLNLNPNVAVPDEFILRMTIENAIEAALVKKLQKTRRELSSGLGYTLAKQYMEGKPTDELLRIFEAGRTLETSEAIQVLAMRDDLRQLWEQATIL